MKRERGDESTVRVSWQVQQHEQPADADFVNSTGMIVFPPGTLRQVSRCVFSVSFREEL